MKHLSSDQLAKLREGALPGSELLPADDHLAVCGECREKLAALSTAASAWTELAGGMRAAALAAETHLSFESLQAYVDGTGLQAERMRIESHLLACGSCRDEAADLKDFAAAVKAPRATYTRLLIFGPIAAVLLLGVLLLKPHEHSTQFAVSLRDGGKTVGLDRQGRLVGADLAGAGERDTIAAMLREGRITVTVPQGLRGKQSVLLGAESTERRFRVLSPLGEVVLQDAPEFRWEAFAHARAYRVQVFDGDYQPVANSSEIAGTSWNPERPLERGKRYVWQVTAIGSGSPVKAPQPPDAEARFEVVASADAAAIEQARQGSAGHLQMAALYAHAGLCREALVEIDALERENGGSPLLQQIHASIAGPCDAQ